MPDCLTWRVSFSMCSCCCSSLWSFRGHPRANSNFAFLQIYSGIDTKLSAKTPVKPWWDWHTGLWQEPFIRHFYINPLIAIGWSWSLVFIDDQVLKSETLHLLWFFWGSKSLQAVFSPHIICTHNCLSRDTFLFQLQIICSFTVRLHQILHTMNGWS